MPAWEIDEYRLSMPRLIAQEQLRSMLVIQLANGPAREEDKETYREIVDHLREVAGYKSSDEVQQFASEDEAFMAAALAGIPIIKSDKVGIAPDAHDDYHDGLDPFLKTES